MLPFIVQPRSSGNQDVDATIIIVVRLNHVQAAGNPLESCLFSGECKSSVAGVAEIINLLFQAHMRNHYVEMPVVRKILNNDTTGSAKRDKSSPRSDVAEFADVIVRGERLLRDQPF